MFSLLRLMPAARWPRCLMLFIMIIYQRSLLRLFQRWHAATLIFSPCYATLLLRHFSLRRRFAYVPMMPLRRLRHAAADAAMLTSYYAAAGRRHAAIFRLLLRRHAIYYFSLLAAADAAGYAPPLDAAIRAAYAPAC